MQFIFQTINRNSEDLALLDPYGAGLSFISISIVFIVLISLYLIFRAIGNIFKIYNLKSNLKHNKFNSTDLKKKESSGEECAAIAMALYYYNSQYHDNEYTILTIKKKSNNYSPWSSKIFGLRKTLSK